MQNTSKQSAAGRAPLQTPPARAAGHEEDGEMEYLHTISGTVQSEDDWQMEYTVEEQEERGASAEALVEQDIQDGILVAVRATRTNKERDEWGDWMPWD